jgi:hypothetical protein
MVLKNHVNPIDIKGKEQIMICSGLHLTHIGTAGPDTWTYATVTNGAPAAISPTIAAAP